jgi:hypothetical protein
MYQLEEDLVRYVGHTLRRQNESQMLRCGERRVLTLGM